jgi:hypothetical protein
MSISFERLIDHGYDEIKNRHLVDPNKNHNESAWSQYFPVAYRGCWFIAYNNGRYAADFLLEPMSRKQA